MPPFGVKPLVIVPCGGKKRDTACCAGEMYIGPYHKACMRYALLLTSENRILILSALYGLLYPTTVIKPYDLRMGQRGSVSATLVRQQATDMILLPTKVVIALGGTAYTSVCKAVWYHCSTPLAGVGGIGHQLSWLNREAERLEKGV